jgi:hypothetical protein
MNASGIALLTEPHPCGHIVYPYTDEALVTQAVCLYTSAGLRNGEAVILVMSEAHREPITRALEAEGFNVAELRQLGQLSCLIAEELLRSFMVTGMPDATRFYSIINNLIRQAKTNSRAGHVRVFGEMVSLLWESNLPAAIRLEELWNDVILTEHISLLCTYTLGCEPHHAIPKSIAALHSHDLSVERIHAE